MLLKIGKFYIDNETSIGVFLGMLRRALRRVGFEYKILELREKETGTYKNCLGDIIKNEPIIEVIAISDCFKEINYTAKIPMYNIQLTKTGKATICAAQTGKE